MLGERFVLLGLARARTTWFRSIATWSTSAVIPAEFVKCVSAEELRAHLTSGRPFSAALLDGGLPSVDRDLLASVRDAGCAPVVVDAPGATRDWRSLGAMAVLPDPFTREQLLDVLGTHAAVVGRGETMPSADVSAGEQALPQAPVVAVCGSGGTGASTVAMALAQGLAAREPVGKTGDARDAAPGPIVLADLCLRAEQAMLHDARDIVPGIQELVEAHRGRRPSIAEIHGLTFHVAERGYHLLLGLRRSRYWSSIRPRSFETGFASLRQAFSVVVCDVTADFEGEDESGSADVEERNLMARTAVGQADVVFAVGVPGVKGLGSLVGLLADLRAFGMPPARVVPVINRAARQPKARAELTRALADLSAGGQEAGSGDGAAPPVFLPRKRVEEALRDGVALPPPLPAVLAGAYRATVTRAASRVPPPAASPQPARVVPGSLGTWSHPEAADG